jgi:hypothetical protein
VTLGLKRGVAGIPVVESVAQAVFDVDYQTTSETFYWPEIPASVVMTAMSLQGELATPQGLARYKAKLPSAAQGAGQVMIHHTSGALYFDSFEAVASYDVPTESGDLSFDATANPLTLPE